MITAGQVGFPQVQKALAGLAGPGGQFAGMMQKQSTTLNGLWSTLSDNVSMTFAGIAQTVADAFHFKDALKVLIDFTGTAGDWINAAVAKYAPTVVAAGEGHPVGRGGRVEQRVRHRRPDRHRHRRFRRPQLAGHGRSDRDVPGRRVRRRQRSDDGGRPSHDGDVVGNHGRLGLGVRPGRLDGDDSRGDRKRRVPADRRRRQVALRERGGGTLGHRLRPVAPGPDLRPGWGERGRRGRPAW